MRLHYYPSKSVRLRDSIYDTRTKTGVVKKRESKKVPVYAQEEEHGTLKLYSAGCRCDLCREKRRVTQAAYKARRLLESKENNEVR